MSWKRNLLIVLAHGLRSDALSDEREWPLPTPHLVGMAERGIRLVLTSACPADPGGMLSVLTGRHPRQHGQLDEGQHHPPLTTGLAGWLRDAGYHTVGVGEVGSMAPLLDESIVTAAVSVAEPEAQGCWYTAAARARGHAPALAQQRRQRLRTGPLAPDRLLLEPDEDIDGFIAGQACEAAGRLPTDRPWAMFVVFSGPGNELPPPLYYDSLLQHADLSRNFVPARLQTLDAMVEPDYPRSLLQRLEAHQIARIRADYLGRVSLIDHSVGRLHDALAQRSDADRLWTVLSSDRGQLLGEHGLIGHRAFLAQALEVPLIVTPPDVPGISPPREKFQDGLFSTVDIAPTIAALAGADPCCSAGGLSKLPGRSLLPIFNGDPVLPLHPANLSEFHDRLLIETERYKAVFRTSDRRCLGLFDLVQDPEEFVNLADRGGSEAARLSQQMRLLLAEALLPIRN